MHNTPTRTHSTQIIRDFVQKLGFTSEESKIYLSLIQKGPQTLLGVSRVSGIERTKLYRMIDALTERGLVEQIPSDKRLIIQATGLNTLEMMVKERERENKLLSESFPFVTGAFNVLSQKTDENQVIYYRGVEGIRTMTWHILDCVDIYRTYSYRFWDDILGSHFVRRLNEEMLLRKFVVHDLYSDQYIEFKKWWYESGHKHPGGDWRFWESRYISEKTVTIDWNLDIYNDTVAYYYWKGEETFGVEIHNARFALFQKQIHDALWKIGRKRPSIDWQRYGKGVYDPKA
ncbi:MAG: helix-turn-helix domain-containing protein [bacterium]|nr:helix-turn-helix domain-containing protein [bacterium]